MGEAESVNPIQEVVLAELDGDPHVRDLDLAERLGFRRPRVIRELIERNRAEFDALGICRTVRQNHGGGRGRPTVEYWLNEEQALLVAVLSNAPNAAAVRRMLIQVFVAWRRGHLEVGGLSGDQVELLRRVDGISRMLAHKVTEIERNVGAQIEAIVNARMAADPRVAALSLVSVVEILEAEWKVPAKGRRSIQRKVFNRLSRHCLEKGIKAYRDARSRVWLFPPHEAAAFIRNDCGALIRDHVAKLNGQGILRLVPREEARP